ncbi:hypothetical protein NDU88_007763 [Pleurodeles waltl]|uniref:Endonuclease/exonuclease/phosphatase domain-containing protein n=1 Tax=Pleurodeles waltl TaxID=8319 RepID=A0AAV7PQ77_PLEWA|nr:hypothetical protein NDU88_007763 [Pleurodeles waltl]
MLRTRRCFVFCSVQFALSLIDPTQRLDRSGRPGGQVEAARETVRCRAATYGSEHAPMKPWIPRYVLSKWSYEEGLPAKQTFRIGNQICPIDYAFVKAWSFGEVQDFEVEHIEGSDHWPLRLTI